MAALLACGDGAVLSHGSAAAFWGLGPRESELEITISPPRSVSISGIHIHRSRVLPKDQVVIDRGFAVTNVLRTLIDLAPRWGEQRIEDAIEAADRRDLCDPERLAAALSTCPVVRGTGLVRKVLERWTLTLTDTQLERRFLPIARRAGLGSPLTQQWLNGSRVDFFFPDLGIVVEADGLRYHRTPVRQTADARRDQRHLAAGLTPLRFSHAQITYHPDEVEAVLRRVAARIRLASGPQA
jgi:very-short-patch-repair endonuclease